MSSDNEKEGMHPVNLCRTSSIRVHFQHVGRSYEQRTQFQSLQFDEVLSGPNRSACPFLSPFFWQAPQPGSSLGNLDTLPASNCDCCITQKQLSSEPGIQSADEREGARRRTKLRLSTSRRFGSGSGPPKTSSGSGFVLEDRPEIGGSTCSKLERRSKQGVHYKRSRTQNWESGVMGLCGTYNRSQFGLRLPWGAADRSFSLKVVYAKLHPRSNVAIMFR